MNMGFFFKYGNYFPCDRSRDGTWSGIDKTSIRQFSFRARRQRSFEIYWVVSHKSKINYKMALSASEARKEHVLAVSRDFISQPRLSKCLFCVELVTLGRRTSLRAGNGIIDFVAKVSLLPSFLVDFEHIQLQMSKIIIRYILLNACSYRLVSFECR